MKNRGTHSTVERVSNATEKRGMARSDRPQRFIITPPKSIPMAAEGRFTAPGQATHTFSVIMGKTLALELLISVRFYVGFLSMML